MPITELIETGLTPNATYYVRPQNAGVAAGPIIQVTTNSGGTLDAASLPQTGTQLVVSPTPLVPSVNYDSAASLAAALGVSVADVGPIIAGQPNWSSVAAALQAMTAAMASDVVL